MEIQRAGEDHSWKLAPTMVPTVRSALLFIQGHVPVVDLVADHSQRSVDRLSPVQPRHRTAPLPQKGLGAKLMSQSRRHGVPIHPSSTQNFNGDVTSVSANAAWPIHLGGQMRKRRDGHSSR